MPGVKLAFRLNRSSHPNIANYFVATTDCFWPNGKAPSGRKQTLEIKESSVSERPLSGKADILLLNPKQQLDQQPFGFQNGCFLPGSGY